MRSALFAFYQGHYSANAMTLAIAGREPLPTLRAWAEELFAPVPNRELPPAAGSVAAAASRPYAARGEGGGLLGTLSAVVPVMELRALTVCWQLPPAKPHWRSKPLTCAPRAAPEQPPPSRPVPPHPARASAVRRLPSEAPPPLTFFPVFPLFWN